MPPLDPFVVSLQGWIDIFMRRSIRNFILYSKESGLSMSQVGALFQINKGRGSVSALGDGLGITHAASSQMLERLVQQQLILRSEDPHDRRVKQLVLTEKGNRILQESIHARQSWLNELACTLSADEKEQVMAAIKILVSKANQLEQSPE